MRDLENKSTRRLRGLLASIALSILCHPAGATTKGLNQIVTPDIQPKGVLSVSFQQVDPNIANRYQVQLELGVTQKLEFALFQGYSPNEFILNGEYGIVQQKHFLLSTGFANYSSMGSSAQPYLESGFLQGNTYVMAGADYVIVQNMGVGGSIRNNHQTQLVLGYAYRVHPRTLLQLDYQSGSGNFLTAGFTYNITPQLQLNPSAYIANAQGHAVYGYAVLTWNIQSFKGFPDFRLGGGGHHAENASPAQGVGARMSQTSGQ